MIPCHFTSLIRHLCTRRGLATYLASKKSVTMLAFRVTVNEAILCLEIKLILAQGCQAGQY